MTGQISGSSGDEREQSPSQQTDRILPLAAAVANKEQIVTPNQKHGAAGETAVQTLGLLLQASTRTMHQYGVRRIVA